MLMTREVRRRAMANMSLWPQGFGSPVVGFECRHGKVVSVSGGVIKLMQGSRVVMFRAREA